MSRKILVVEDNKDLARLLELHLRDLTYDVDLAFDGDAGWTQITSQPYDLIVLDLMLPGIDGLEICRRIRSRPAYTPILMLTSKSTELVKAIFRRIDELQSDRRQSKQALIQAADLVIDSQRRTVSLGDRTIDLTAKEFDLLLHFARHAGRVFTRSQLLDEVWGYGHDGYEHTVNSHINRLRAKIEANPTQPCYILTVWGVGYKFAEFDNVSEFL